MNALKNWLELQVVRLHSLLIARSLESYAPSRVHFTVRLDNPKHISLGGASIGRGVWLYAMTSDSAGRRYDPRLSIGSGTSVGDYCHITCAHSVRIGSKVLMTQGVLITDAVHCYDDVEKPVISQGLAVSSTSVGDGSWIGNHAAVIGCHVGRNCVIGANAVVKRDVPDFCVVVGAPARIVRRYDPGQGLWRATDATGSFRAAESGQASLLAANIPKPAIDP